MPKSGKKRLKLSICILTALMLMLICIPAFGICADSGERSITLICRKEQITLTGMKWKLYKVGERTGNGFALTGDFARYPVNFKEITEENVAEKAKTLESYAVADGIAPVGSGETDKNGELKFSGLTSGIYLAVGRILRIGNTYYVPSSLLLEADETDVSFSYDAYPKFSYATLGGAVGSYMVRKVWVNDSADNVAHPTYVTVDLFKNGELYDTVTLNEANNWEHRWRDLEPINDWHVVEREIPSDYTVIIDFNSTQYLIKNSFRTEELPPITTTTGTNVTTTGPAATTTVISTSDISSTNEQDTTTVTAVTQTTAVIPPTTTSVKLPPLVQTGQLWWPVIPLGAGGILLVSLGTLIKSRKDEK